ncbi:PAS-domain containing protein [Defluviicoccus vanus]|uniref:histidine kinase n=1 Tax=Defluviicoccus vanus TaxID=111831 RepID=A0A7H1N2I5_9PROT|nr:PAS-domain containing protein [Defluviicoccus vanus]QNT69921.1 PAS-domain containing protein [Defluviicoccus vanus]
MRAADRVASRSIQQRLFLILAVASALVTIASLLAIFAMSRIRAEFESVSARELPETTAALRLAQIGERLQGRAGALIAAKDAVQRTMQMRLIAADVDALAHEVQQLKAAQSHETDLIGGISTNALALRENLTAIGELLTRQSDLTARLNEGLLRTLQLQDSIRQILGPSILAITDAVDRGLARSIAGTAAGPGDASKETFTAAVAAQAPLREAERLADAALNSLLIAIEAGDEAELEATLDRFRRALGEWQQLIPTMPAGLRLPLRVVTGHLTRQVQGSESIFRIRREALATLQRADALMADNRLLADRLSEQVDRLVASASATVARAERSMNSTIVRYTFLLAGLSIAAIATAVFISYLFIIRDLGAGMRSITSAMMRLAGGEHDTAVPAIDRRDEIGDLARAFAVFQANARRMVTLDRQLVEKSNLLVATFDNMNDGFSVYDGKARLVAWNAQFVHLYELPEDILVPGTPIEAIQRIVANRGVVIRTPVGRQVEPPELSLQRLRVAERFEIDLTNGRTIELRSNPIPTGGFVTIHIDITERKAIELQLRQAQKMEVVGQLTGGLAHDFNNLLAVIQGNLHLLEDQLHDQPQLQERATRALAAGERAAMQIERLLAFSRRQKLHPESVDIRELVVGITDLLAYSVGEGVEIRTELANGLPPVLVDPGQLDNALLNLALNARDAMDGRGTLTIGVGPATTSGATGQPSGAFVEISVRDTGRGMSADVIERAIEPFFTTKAPGKGSGLGLSMVYGFVRQSGGVFRLESVPGAGTSIIFTLPVTDQARAAAARSGEAAVVAVAADHDRPLGDVAGTTVLVVEDDPGLREIVSAQVRGLGYRVVEAADANAALECLRADAAIRLLYTDIVLGDGANGFVLASTARAMRPSIGIIFTSAERPAALEALTDDPGLRDLLQKPVRLDNLAAAFTRCLAQAADAHTSSTSESKT